MSFLVLPPCRILIEAAIARSCAFLCCVAVYAIALVWVLSALDATLPGIARPHHTNVQTLVRVQGQDQYQGHDQDQYQGQDQDHDHDQDQDQGQGQSQDQGQGQGQAQAQAQARVRRA